MNTVYAKDLFHNMNIPYLFNRDICEYDMKEAGYSLIKEFKQLDEKKIQKLENMTKEKRKVQIGLWERDDEDFRKLHTESFQTARRLFVLDNELEDNDIISIKKDAIFTCKTCKKEKITKNIEFRLKNLYTSFIRISSRLEFYYSPDKLDVKGLSDENYLLHEDYMIKFIKSFFFMMENNSELTTLDYLMDFINKYKRRELNVGYYRTFDHRSEYIVFDKETVYEEYYDDEESKKELDISFNYNLILLKLLKILL